MRRYEIKGAPGASIRRLLDKLDLAKEALELQRSISAKSKQLEAITREFEDTRAKILTLKRDALKPIREVQNSAIGAIEKASAEGVDSIRAIYREALEHLVKTREMIIQAIETLRAHVRCLKEIGKTCLSVDISANTRALRLSITKRYTLTKVSTLW